MLGLLLEGGDWQDPEEGGPSLPLEEAAPSLGALFRVPAAAPARSRQLGSVLRLSVHAPCMPMERGLAVPARKRQCQLLRGQEIGVC